MSETKTTPAMFSKDNYVWMLAGLVLIAIGMFLMSGGKSNTDRITVAPILILAGLVVEIFAIFKKSKTA